MRVCLIIFLTLTVLGCRDQSIRTYTIPAEKYELVLPGFRGFLPLNVTEEALTDEGASIIIKKPSGFIRLYIYSLQGQDSLSIFNEIRKKSQKPEYTEEDYNSKGIKIQNGFGDMIYHDMTVDGIDYFYAVLKTEKDSWVMAFRAKTDTLKAEKDLMVGFLKGIEKAARK